MSWRCAVLAAFALVLTGRVAAAPALPRDVELTEDILVRRVHWPVLVLPGRSAAGACEALGPRDISIEEDARPVRVVAVDRNGPPTLYVLMFDTSYSMRDHLERCRESAREFAIGLGPSESVAIARFDDDLALLQPPTRDIERVGRALQQVRVGGETALRNALAQVIDYLNAFGGRKVIVLFTDGEDNVAAQRSFDEVLGRAEQVTDLRVFTLAMPPVDKSRRWLSTRGLQQAAETTGGHVYLVEKDSELGALFTDLRARLGREWSVTYQPSPATPQDAAGPSRHAVVVRPRADLPCRVESILPHRLAGVSTTPRLVATEPVSIAASDAPCGLDAGGAPLPAWRARDLPFLPAGAAQPLFLLPPSRAALLARVGDLVQEPGILYRAEPYLQSGLFRTRIQREPEYAERMVCVALPSLSELREKMRRPEDALAWLLERHVCGPCGATLGGAISPLLLHGETFLNLRPAIAQAMYLHEPEYRRWARERSQAMRAKELGERFEQMGPAAPSPEQQAALAAQLADSAGDPPPLQLQRALAEWLGDVAADRLFASLEARLGSGLLVGAGGEPAGPLQCAFDHWSDLAALFPPPLDVRVRVPLVPLYDPERDAVGFYRVILPHADAWHPPADLVSSSPLALHTLRWAVSDPAVAAAARGFEVLSVVYPRSDEVTPCPGERARDCRLHAVDLRLGSSRAGVVNLHATFASLRGMPHRPDTTAGPLCVEVDASPTVRAEAAGLLEQLGLFAGRAGRLCSERLFAPRRARSTEPGGGASPRDGNQQQ
ncbi:MAG: VWA domain-containing protein [Acidobacteria bacterium]|nr:VWA domain-containing protein [Acidobacteriota bacterium]